MTHAPRLAILAVAAVLAAALPACGDNPFELNWTARPDTVLLHSLARPELNLSSGFNFVERRTVRIESPGVTGSWDLALDTQDGRLVFLPPGALDVRSRAAISVLEGMDFQDVREVPSDSASYSFDVPVPVETGTVYGIQTHEARGSFGRVCVFYAKLEPVRVDPEAGTISFVYDASPVCDDPRVVPPDG